MSYVRLPKRNKVGWSSYFWLMSKSAENKELNRSNKFKVTDLLLYKYPLISSILKSNKKNQLVRKRNYDFVRPTSSLTSKLLSFSAPWNVESLDNVTLKFKPPFFFLFQHFFPAAVGPLPVLIHNSASLTEHILIKHSWAQGQWRTLTTLVITSHLSKMVSFIPEKLRHEEDAF